MYLVIHQMMEFQEVYISDSHIVIKQLAGAPVIKTAFAVRPKAGQIQNLTDGFFVSPVENRACNLPAQGLCGIAQMHLQNLPDVHTGWHAQRIEDNIQGCAVRHIRHVLAWQYTGHDALITMAAGHFVAHGYLALMRDIYPDNLIYPRAHFIAALPRKDFDVNNNAAFTMGNLQGGVSDFPCLFAKNSAQKAFLRSQVGLPLRCDLTDENVAASDLGADTDDAALVQIFQRVVADARNIPCNLLGSELGIAGIAFIFLHMNRGEHVVHDQALADQDGVLIVIAFPGHESHQDILSQGNLPLACGRAVRDHVAFRHPIPHRNDGPLIYAGTLVGPAEFNELIVPGPAGIVPDDNICGRNRRHHARAVRQHHNA